MHVLPRHGGAVIRHTDTREIYILAAKQKHEEQKDNDAVDADDKPENSSHFQIEMLDDVTTQYQTNQAGWHGDYACNKQATSMYIVMYFFYCTAQWYPYVYNQVVF